MIKKHLIENTLDLKSHLLKLLEIKYPTKILIKLLELFRYQEWDHECFKTLSTLDFQTLDIKLMVYELGRLKAGDGNGNEFESFRFSIAIGKSKMQIQNDRLKFKKSHFGTILIKVYNSDIKDLNSDFNAYLSLVQNRDIFQNGSIFHDVVNDIMVDGVGMMQFLYCLEFMSEFNGKMDLVLTGIIDALLVLGGKEFFIKKLDLFLASRLELFFENCFRIVKCEDDVALVGKALRILFVENDCCLEQRTEIFLFFSAFRAKVEVFVC
jgi:hypothetical protein